MIKRWKWSIAFCTFAMLLTNQLTFAEVKLPALIGDNMVLQRGMKVPVYGNANVGEVVQVEFIGKTFKTTTGADGKWLIKLNSYNAGGPYEMTIKGSNSSIILKNILIGDVWLSSGQSNMEFGIQTDKHAADAIAKGTDNQIHFFYVPMALSPIPLTEVGKTSADSPNGKWMVCSPDLLANTKFAWHGFSAVSYYFALQIRKSEGIPMGMIGSYRGGTPVQAWISKEGLAESPAFTKYLDANKKLADNYAQAVATYPQRRTAYQDSLKIWNTEVGTDFNATLKKWDADVATARATAKTPPPRPTPSRPAPKSPAEPDGGYQAPIGCYNGVIAPLVGYGIKGVLWYQGESNGDNFDDAVAYKDLFPRLITNWRKLWNQGDFPFLYVQLPNFHAAPTAASQGFWPWVREGQAKTLLIKNTSMAVITDVGETNDVHPTNKLDPGNRLALVAQRTVYGHRIGFAGPVYKSMKVDGNKIIINFSEINKGLVTGTAAGDGSTINMTGQELKGFGIAGDDHKFVWAKATIVGNKVEVSADGVSNPVAVRYNWVDNTPGNLYSKDGLPARPFRTDDWVATK